ncbi:MAG: FecR domain-containing protein [Saprospiraceae bacterium]
MKSQAVLIEKLFRSECTKEELMALLKLMENNMGGDHGTIMKLLWNELEQYPDLHSNHSELIYNETLSKIKNKKLTDQKAKIVSLPVPQRRFLFRRIAVVALLLVTAGFAWNGFYSNKTITVSTAYAETKKIQLPDGSMVELNAGSQLSYDQNWCASCNRKVRLIGEAFFEVTKKVKTGQKFQVITSDLTVEVLGTAFNVNTLHNQTQVFLEEGLVKLDLGEAAEEMVMNPGDVVTYSIKTKERKKQHFIKEESIIWRDGFTSMKNIALERILEKIEDLYGVKFMPINSDNLDRKFTIGIPVDNFETTLTVLKEVTKLDIIKKGNHYAIQ